MTPKDRDNAFEPLLRMRWQSGPAQRGADCADAAILAAFVERKLTIAERSRWEAHFADCAYCTAVLGAAARAGRELPQTSPARWWMIPVAGSIVAAATAALFLHLQSLNRLPPTRAVLAESRRTDEPASVDQKRVAKMQPGAVGVQPLAPQMLTMNEPIMREANAQPAAPGLAGALNDEQKTRGVEARAKTDRRASSFSERAIANGASALEGGVAKKDLYSATTSVAGASDENRLANSATLFSAERDKAASGIANPTIEVRSLDGTTEWRIGSRGSIAHREQTSSWAAQSSGVESDLIAGSAPSSEVCWVVGRGGVILRTTDGEHWEKLASPIKGDFAAVVAQSAISAIVTASDGRRFATVDGGAIWLPR
jgi:hypothetical protein